MFIISINLVLLCCLLGINGSNIEITVKPTRCGKLFCESFDNYPKENITKLIVDNEGYINSQQDIEIELGRTLFGYKAIKGSLCDCSLRNTVPLVGLNVYNTTRFIVNIDQYKQEFLSCSKNLTEKKEFKSTLCYNVKPTDDDHYISMCLPKYQRIVLNVVKDNKLYLDEFYVIPLYTCVLVPK